MAKRTFEEELKKAIDKYNKVKECVDLFKKMEKKADKDYDFYKSRKYNNMKLKCRDMRLNLSQYFCEDLPDYIQKNDIKGDELTKFAMVFLKYSQLDYCYDFRECINVYVNESNANNKMILEELAKMRYSSFDSIGPMYMSDIDLIFDKYNFEYQQNHVLQKENIDKVTNFVIKYKKSEKLDLNKFEERILKDGKFINLYRYLYEVENCNQKAVLTKILEIATPEQLKMFSRADADRKESTEAYSSGYSAGQYYSGDFDLC